MNENFSFVACSVCGREDWQTVYSSVQNVSDIAGEIQVDLVMCNGCAFLFNNPQPTRSLLDAHYQVNSSGSVFREVSPDSRTGRLTRLRVDFVKRFMAPGKAGKILDVGCGNGFFLESLPAGGWEKCGIDLSPRSGRNISDRNIELLTGDVLELETSRKFDLITCFSSFEHFRGPELVLQKIATLLNPGGKAIIDVPDSSFPVPGLEEYFCFEHLSSFTRPTLTMFFNNHQFEVVEFARATAEFQSLLCAAEKCDLVPVQAKEDPQRVHQILADYKTGNEALKDGIREKLQTALAPILARNGKIAVYGAGFHNYFLFKLFEFEAWVSVFIDSDPDKWGQKLMGKTIIPPQEIDGLAVDAVLISSHHFENEIFNTISRYNSTKLPVIKLYDEQFQGNGMGMMDRTGTQGPDHSGDVLCTKDGVSVINCLQCGFKHIMPIPTEKQLDEFYSVEFYDNLWPDSITNSIAEQGWNEIGFVEKFEKFEELLPDQGHRKLLDIGSGSGHFLKCGQERNWNVLGLEPATTAHEFATEKLGVQVRNCTFTRDNFDQFGKFHVVTMNKVFEHLRDPGEVLALVHRILIPGGLVCLTVPNDFNPLQEIAAEYLQKDPWWVDPKEHINYFDSSSLQGLVNRCGFTTEHISTGFPLELFLLMGDDYISDSGVGKTIHGKRKRLEMALAETGNTSLKKELYDRFAALGLGRELTIFARKS